MEASGSTRHVEAAVSFQAYRRCGACVAVCPVHAVTFDKYGLVVEGCTICPGLVEGLRLAACPAEADYDALEQQLFGRPRLFPPYRRKRARYRRYHREGDSSSSSNQDGQTVPTII